METHTPLAAALLMTGCRQARPIDSYEKPFFEFTDSSIASQGSLNHSGMNYSTSPLSYDNNHHPLNLLENQCHNSVCLSDHHSHHYSGVTHVSLPDETSLFVANYLCQLRLTFGTDMTLDQAIRVCGGQCDTPDAKPTHGQAGRDVFVSNLSSPSMSYTGAQSNRSATRQSTPNERAYFRSSAVTQTNHEIFRDGGRLKVRCHEGPCSGNVLMKDNYARHVREHHLGGKRKAGGSSIRRVNPGMK
ncbi:uncharacterized protein BJ212DRAFT_817567 [Suillus subaureus]|uniref:C2H2-type domain-containing protein n=1 Tax=Suillus subaureus TaxID=48587 RepID=A0A9P7EJM4_9AGAM|nr:uncharacterized protein BJ212DRAFT_817567 [Suillus subaureus]KAG1822639.1 hypothetical protein BJ212DRAFT_817567 [Suillus subaureus]